MFFCLENTKATAYDDGDCIHHVSHQYDDYSLLLFLSSLCRVCAADHGKSLVTGHIFIYPHRLLL